MLFSMTTGPAKPSMFQTIMRAEHQRPQPPAERVNLRPVVLVGSGMWTIALITLVIIAVREGSGLTTGIGICIAGIALGVLALLWERRHRSRYLK